MKNRAEKSEKFRFKMNFGFDSGACQDAGASHSLSMYELPNRPVSALKSCKFWIFRVISTSRLAPISTAIKTNDLAGRVSPRLVHNGASGIAAVMNCFRRVGVTPSFMIFSSVFMGGRFKLFQWHFNQKTKA